MSFFLVAVVEAENGKCHFAGTFITSHCPQDLGDSSKNPVLVIWDDKDAESKEDRKTGKKYKRKRQ